MGETNKLEAAAPFFKDSPAIEIRSLSVAFFGLSPSKNVGQGFLVSSRSDAHPPETPLKTEREGGRRIWAMEKGREGKAGMVYFGVTMGKCFYCMLLASPAWLQSAISLRRFRAPRSEILRAEVQLYPNEVSWLTRAAKQVELPNLAWGIMHHC